MTAKPTYENLEQRVTELEQEIEKLRRSEGALLENEYQTRQYLAIAGIIFVALDNRGDITLINEYGLETLGYEREELLGKNWFKTCLTDSSQDNVLEVYHQLIRGEIAPVEYYENAILRKDGTERIVAWHNTVLKNLKGEIIGVLSSGEDVTERNHIENVMKKSEARFRDISLSMADWIWEVDAKGTYTFAAGKIKKILGYTEKEIIGKTPFDFMPISEIERIKTVFADCLSKKEPIVDLANWNLKKDGTRVCLLTNAMPLLNDAGEIEGYRGIDKDITDDILAEETLKHSLRITELIIDMMPIGMMIVGKDQKVRRINRAALEMLGYASNKKIIGTQCTATICSIEGKKCPVLDLKQKMDKSEKTMVHKNGHRIPVIKSVLPVNMAGETVLLEAFMDIADLKKAKKALRENEKKYQTIMETFADPVAVYDTQGLLTYANPAFTKIFGWNISEILGSKVDFVPDESHLETITAIKTVLEKGRLTGFETRRYTKDGRIIDTRLSGGLLQDESGAPVGIVVNFQDITEQKQNQAELEQAKKQAEDASRIKSEFLANMSHEIRTPMNGVIGMASLLLGTELSAEQKDFTKAIQSSGDALLSVINDILDYSKIEAGKLDLEIIDFDLRVVLDEMSDLVALKAHEKGLEFINIVHHEIPSLLKGDPGRLRQILINLTGNAIKFTKKGEVAIHTTLEDTDSSRATIRFGVTDTGIGIPQDRMDRLFKSFSQVDGSTARKFGGTGLGLSIAKQLVEKMGGQVGVKSEVGRGSEFWFTAVFEKQPERQVKPTIIPHDISKSHVLIVDDNATNRYVLREQLKLWGCHFSEASGGIEAIEKLKKAITGKNPFDIAVLDMQMPEMDGETLGKKIKKDPELKNTILVLMTSMGDRGDAKRLEKIGFAAYLTKPVKQSHLYDCLAMVTGIQKKPGKKQPAAIVTRHSLAEDRKRKGRILLAEDNIINQKVALNMLKKFGYRAQAVGNGREAVEMLAVTPFDIVLMDCQMPEMDGYEATGEIRNPESKVLDHKVTVIAMTAHAMKGDRKRCLTAGMDDYLTKPIKPQKLCDMIDKWISRTRMHS